MGTEADSRWYVEGEPVREDDASASTTRLHSVGRLVAATTLILDQLL